MFECKFCLREMDRHYESRSHFGMCKDCYTRTMKYKRIKIRGSIKDHKEASFVKIFERQCRHNISVGAYVPKSYTDGVDTTIKYCPYCGARDAEVYPYATNMCYDCGKIENTYRSTLHRLEGKLGWNKQTKDGKQAYGYDKALGNIAEIEKYYEKMAAQGFKVPNSYLERSRC